jgi:hypothetical protein
MTTDRANSSRISWINRSQDVTTQTTTGPTLRLCDSPTTRRSSLCSPMRKKLWYAVTKMLRQVMGEQHRLRRELNALEKTLLVLLARFREALEHYSHALRGDTGPCHSPRRPGLGCDGSVDRRARPRQANAGELRRRVAISVSEHRAPSTWLFVWTRQNDARRCRHVGSSIANSLDAKGSLPA